MPSFTIFLDDDDDDDNGPADDSDDDIFGDFEDLETGESNVALKEETDEKEDGEKGK